MEVLGLGGPEWTLGLVLLEYLLAAWLLAGCRAASCRVAAVGMFCAFAGAGLLEALAGHEHCGCFGVLQLPYAFMVPLDLLVAVGLALGTPRPLMGDTWRRPLLARTLWLAVLGACGVPVLAAAASYFALGQRTVVLTPENISGRVADFLAHVRAGQQLAHGRWCLLVYRSDCRRCAAALPAFAQAAQRKRDVRYAVLLLPGSALPAIEEEALKAFEAEPSVRWYALTPLVLELRDGVVERVHPDVRAASMGDRVGRASPRSLLQCVTRFDTFPASQGSQQAFSNKLTKYTIRFAMSQPHAPGAQRSVPRAAADH